MSITSFTFYFAFILIFVISILLRKHGTQRKSFLLIVSYLFYALVDWRFPILLLFLSLFNFAIGNKILTLNKSKQQKLYLFLAVIGSLAILFYFKYANFFIEQATSILGFGIVERQQYLLNVLMPVGISFMTFQAITYPIDCFRKNIDKAASPLDFALFMAFFPQLLAGPIVRASYFIPQLQNVNKIDTRLVYEGLWQIVRGLIKKIVIADTLAFQIVDPAFADPSQFSSTFLIIAIFTFSIQIYMDLSGYTDIALGLGKMLGYKLPVNFNRPYLATSIANYWQRWHITMSSFFRDYLYSFIETWKWCGIYTKLIIVFVAIGFWHGAGWNFLLYGAIHGSLVALEHYKKAKRTALGKPPILHRRSILVLQIFKIFTIVALTRLLFRGDSIGSSYDYLVNIFATTSSNTPLTPISMLLITVAIILHISPVSWRDNFVDNVRRVPSIISSGMIVVAIYLMIIFSITGAGFIYFEF